MEKELVAVLDFGGQYNQLIARRLRELNVYCEVYPYDIAYDKLIEKQPKGIVFTGGPKSVYEPEAPKCDERIFSAGIPVLGICYGMQVLAQSLGGAVKRPETHEYGKNHLTIAKEDSLLLQGVDRESVCWMSHTDYVSSVPQGFACSASTPSCAVAAFEDAEKKLYGVQFHPEVTHTTFGTKILENFVKNICGLSQNWTMKKFAEEKIKEMKAEIGDEKVLCALSGGVDSSVAAVLMHRAIGENLVCIFVDHGLMRKNEGDEVERVFKNTFHMNFIRVNAQKRFLDKLAGVVDPERKRKIIGEEFIRVFEEEAVKLEGIEYLLQGTIYPDVIESGTKDAAAIKSHHNVGGLPEDLNLKLVEPLRELFKDEVRAVGRELGIPDMLVDRQPFPGPGLAVRVIGDITQEKLDILREADYIFRDEIKKAGLDKEIWQYFALLPGNRSVGVMGDERTYDYTIALRAVNSIDGMTADWARIPHEVLESISTRIVNEAAHVNRVVYDITTKPPSTIEWE